MPPVYTAALLATGAFGVHQLRYLLAYGEQTDDALGASGHGYLTFAEPLIGLALAFAAGHLVQRLARAPQFLAPLRRGRMAALFGLALFAVFAGQELLEAQLAHGRTGVFADGGWIAAPLALAIGALLSLLARAGHAADTAVLVVHRVGVRLAWRATAPSAPVAPATGAVACPLSSHLAGRAPPLSATS